MTHTIEIKVRKGHVTDWQDFAMLLRAFRNDPVTPPWFAGENEHPNSEKFLVATLSGGVSFIAHEDKDAIGMLLAIKSHVPFTNNPIVEELAWYVLPDYRGTRAGLLLLTYWENLIEELKEKKEIHGGIIHTMARSPIDLVKRGYVVSDITYMR